MSEESFDIERLLLWKIVHERDLTHVLNARITDEFFESIENAKIYRFILDHFNAYGEVPSRKDLRGNFPNYLEESADSSIDYYIDLLRDRYKYAAFSDSMAEARELMVEERDVDAAVNSMAASISRLSIEVSSLRDTDLFQNQQSRWDQYLAYEKSADGLLGLPSGFPTIDMATGGFQPEQLVTIIGTPKAGKSTVMMKAAISAHEYGRVPLLVTYEMSTKEQEARHDAIQAGISHWRLTRGRLKPDEKTRLKRFLLRDSKSMHPFHMSADISGGATVSALAAKIGQYQPDILFVDGVYLMTDEITGEQNSPQALTNITRALKRLAQTRRIPIAISTQVLEWKINKRKGVTASGIGYASSFHQDSDVIIALESTDDEDEKILKVVASRNCGLTQTHVRWDWESAEFEEFDPPEEDEDERPSPF